MSLGERIKLHRQRLGMSQEMLAERIGVSRQAVTKWEADRSAPDTANLFKLAELFGTTVDLLLPSAEEPPAVPEQACHPATDVPKQVSRFPWQALKRNLLSALLVAVGYALLYLIGRFIWCDLSQTSLTGWLFAAKPAGENSYLYGWLLSSHLFWYTAALSILFALFGKRRLAYTTLLGFVVGFVAGILFGPYPEGAVYGHNHRGWLIWGECYLFSIPLGCFVERYIKKLHKSKA